MTIAAETARLHVRFEGRSEDLDLAELGLAPGAADGELRAALARRYDRSLADLAGYVIVREKTAIVLRPEAFYG
jgi:hypothetical protein